MVQDDTSLAKRVADILGPSSAAAQALAHVACVKTQGGHGCIFYVKGYWIVQNTKTVRAAKEKWWQD
jgi:hypothetical protein